MELGKPITSSPHPGSEEWNLDPIGEDEIAYYYSQEYEDSKPKFSKDTVEDVSSKSD